MSRLCHSYKHILKLSQETSRRTASDVRGYDDESWQNRIDPNASVHTVEITDNASSLPSSFITPWLSLEILSALQKHRKDWQMGWCSYTGQPIYAHAGHAQRRLSAFLNLLAVRQNRIVGRAIVMWINSYVDSSETRT